MKFLFSLLRKARKGMTLLELVIAMALTSIILTGAGVALYSMQKTSARETKNHVCLTDAKSLLYAMDILVKDETHNSVTLIKEKLDNIGKVSCDRLFTVVDNEVTSTYGFNKNVFGKITGSDIKEEDVIFKSTYQMYISLSEKTPFTEIIIHYGTNYSQALSLVERI